MRERARGAAAPGAGAGAPPRAAPLPVALVGAGKVAFSAHLREPRDLPHLLRPAAVVDPDPAHLAAVRAAGHPEVPGCGSPAEAARTAWPR